MARTANKVTVIRFVHGRELLVQPTPDEVIRAIKEYDGGLARVPDVNGNPAWINPREVVTITSHRPRRRQKTSEAEIDAELEALAAKPESRRGPREAP